MTGRYCFYRCLSVNIFGGGSQSQVRGVPVSGLGGVPVSGSGGSQSQVRGVPVSGPGGIPVSGPGGSQSQARGGPSLRSRVGGSRSQVQGGYPVSVKGTIFDTRFGLIHVQTGKKNFHRGIPPLPASSQRDPPLPASKGKIF